MIAAPQPRFHRREPERLRRPSSPRAHLRPAPVFARARLRPAPVFAPRPSSPRARPRATLTSPNNVMTRRFECTARLTSSARPLRSLSSVSAPALSVGALSVCICGGPACICGGPVNICGGCVVRRPILSRDRGEFSCGERQKWVGRGWFKEGCSPLGEIFWTGGEVRAERWVAGGGWSAGGEVWLWRSAVARASPW